jgi:hypothetical protein
LVDDVFWFEIAVYDFVGVHVVQCLADLLHDGASGFLVEFSLLLEEGVELSRAAELLNEVEVLLIAEEAVEPDDVGVVQEALDLHLAGELRQELLIDLLFAYDLYRAYKTGLLVLPHEHLSEFARSQQLTQREVIDS